MNVFRVLLVALALALFSSFALAATTCGATYETQSEASSACDHDLVTYYGAPYQCVLKSATKLYQITDGYHMGPSYSFCAASNYCTAGEIVPPGTNYTQSSTTGEACTSGTTSCEMSFVVGGANSGAQMLTGNACPSAGTQTGVVPPKAAQTVNADGSITYCDLITGKCVTAGTVAQAPASSSSSANNSTDTASTTQNPATSSSSSTTSTSTTTTTGDGTGSGSGNSTSVTIGSSTTRTDTPASASSTSSKCTGGACDVGLADGNLGQMYQGSTDTPASVYGNFKAQVSGSPIISAATGFFNASALNGSTCPTWQIPGNKYWGQSGFSFDFFCSSGMLALLALAGYMVLAVGAFSAFRIAIY